jgi:hypothetical protein
MVDSAQVKAAPSPDLLAPDNAVMLFVDRQPQTFLGTGSGDRTAAINSTVGLAAGLCQAIRASRHLARVDVRTDRAGRCGRAVKSVVLDALMPFADGPCEETAIDHDPAEQSHSNISAVAVNRASRDVSSL